MKCDVKGCSGWWGPGCFVSPSHDLYYKCAGNQHFFETAWKYLTKGEKMDVNAPEPKPEGKGREITPLVVKDLQERSAMGVQKYGEVLHSHNGRNPLVDLYQELLDAVQYLRQKLEEDEQERVTRVYLKQVKDCDLPHPFLGQGTVELGPKLVPESIAQEAHRLVLGDRGEQYGHPIFDMTRSADMLTALLRNKLRPGVQLEAEDIGQAMICVKQSRHRNKPKRDNNTDTAGYALTLEMIAEWRATHPGVDPRDVFPE